MSDIKISIDNGTSKRLLTAGKYCDKNILVTATGGGTIPSPAVEKDVSFYDYDGTLLYSYTTSEAQSLAQLPAPPQHKGLTFQKWNYSLESVKAATKKLNIGALYITDDGKTRLYINIPASALSSNPPPRSSLTVYIQQTVENGVAIDWGDDTGTETVSGINKTTEAFAHTYQQSGDFVITLTADDGCTFVLGGGNFSKTILGSARDDKNKVYLNLLKKIQIGDGVTSIGDYTFYSCRSLNSVSIPDGVTSIGDYTFYSCYSLNSVSIPDGVTSIGDYTFSSCYSLNSVSIPDGVTSIGDYTFYSCRSLNSVSIPDGVTSIGDSVFSSCYSLNSVSIPDDVTSIGDYTFSSCYSLNSVSIPDGVTSIGDYTFYSCYSLNSVSIPDGVTSIGGSAFSSCYGVKEYLFYPKIPPTLSNRNALNNIPDDCIIYVPKGSGDTYKSATNWTTYADKIQEMEL